MFKNQNGIFNFFSRKVTKIKNICYIIALILIVFFYKNATDIFSDQNLFYYVFSTIVQGYLALVSFLGAVVIYKLQIFENSLNNINESLKQPARYFKGFIADSYAVEEMMKLHDEILKRPMEEWDRLNIDRIKTGCEKMGKMLDEKREIRSKMVDFSLLSFVNIGMALMGFVITRLLLLHNLYFYSGIYLVLNITLSFASMVYAFKVIRKTLGYDFHITI